jgi:hypothetical protein
MAYWSSDYLSIPLYLLLLIAIISGFKIWKTQGKLWKWEGLRFHSLVVIAGLLLFMMVLGKQFVHHDYYIISTFIPLVFVWIMWWFRYRLPQVKLHAGIVKYLLIGLTIFALARTPNSFHQRIQDTYKMRNHVIENNVGWLKTSQVAIQESGMQATDTIFALYHESPNIPLVYFDKKGLSFNHEEITRDQKFVEFWLDRLNPDFFVAPRTWANLLSEHKKHLMPNLTQVFENNDIVVWRCEQNWSEFLALRK